MKIAEEIIKALYNIANAIKGNNKELGGGDEKSLGYFELTNKPIGVIETDKSGIHTYAEEALIKIEDLVEQLVVPKREVLTYLFVYDKDVSNTVNFNTISSIGNATIANGRISCDELASNRFCFRLSD